MGYRRIPEPPARIIPFIVFQFAPRISGRSVARTGHSSPRPAIPGCPSTTRQFCARSGGC